MKNTEMTISLSVNSIVDSILALSALARTRRGDSGASSVSVPRLLCRREAPALGRMAAQAFGVLAVELMPYVLQSEVDDPENPAILSLELKPDLCFPDGGTARIGELLEGAVMAEVFRRLWADVDLRRAASYAAMARESIELLVLRLRGEASSAHPGVRAMPWGAWSW